MAVIGLHLVRRHRRPQRLRMPVLKGRARYRTGRLSILQHPTALSLVGKVVSRRRERCRALVKNDWQRLGVAALILA